MALYFIEGLREIVDEVIDMLGSDRQADRAGIDVLLGEFLFVELGVSGRGGVDNQTFHVGYIGKQREYLKRVDEALSCLAAAFELDREY